MNTDGRCARNSRLSRRGGGEMSMPTNRCAYHKPKSNNQEKHHPAITEVFKFVQFYDFSQTAKIAKHGKSDDFLR